MENQIFDIIMIEDNNNFPEISRLCGIMIISRWWTSNTFVKMSLKRTAKTQLLPCVEWDRVTKASRENINKKKVFFYNFKKMKQRVFLHCHYVKEVRKYPRDLCLLKITKASNLKSNFPQLKRKMSINIQLKVTTRKVVSAENIDFATILVILGYNEEICIQGEY